MVLRRLIVFCFALFLSLHTLAQNEIDLGVFPEVTTFSVNDFKSSAQIWHGVQGKEGNLYFSNNKGVLIFDGSRWGRIATHQGEKITRMFRSSSDSIYVSGENEIGVLVYDSLGKPNIKLMFSDRMVQYGLGLIWNIIERKDKSLLFIGSGGILSYSNGIPKLIYRLKKGKITTSARFGQGYLVLVKYDSETNSGKTLRTQLMYLADGETHLTEVQQPSSGEILNIRGVLDHNKQLILFDEEGKTFTCIEQGKGTFMWVDNTVSFQNLTKYKVNSVHVHKNYVYVGTDANGLVIYNKKGQFIRAIDDSDGLSNLSVFEMFFDNNNNLWLLLDNGIALVEMSSPVTAFTPDQGVLASTEAITYFRKKYLLSTRTDLFLSKKGKDGLVFENSGFADEPTYGVEKFSTSKGEKCLVIGYNGIYEVSPTWKKIVAASNVYAWCLKQSVLDKDVIYCGLEKPGGIGKLTLTDKGWEYEELINKTGGLSRSLAQIGNKIYFAVLNKGVGVYDIKTKKTRYLSEKPKLKGNLVYYVDKFRGKIIVGTNNGLYELNTSTSTFEPIKQVKNSVLFEPKLYIHRIHNEEDKRLWLVMFRNEETPNEKREIGYLEIIDGQWIWNDVPLAIVENDVIHDITHDTKNHIWFGGEKGVYVYNAKAKRNVLKPFSVNISRIQTAQDTIYYLKNSRISDYTMKFAKNFIKFQFSSPIYYGIEETKYRTKLVGVESNWTEWSTVNIANYTKLPEGSYQFMVQSKDIYDHTSAVTTFSFTILPPWYRTWWAYLLYVVFGVLIIIGIIRVSIHRVKQQNQKLEDTVKIRTQEIAEQNHVLEHQKNEIESKNKDILDSIKYAKRIQNTILPDSIKLGKYFREHFVFFRPKDIVSGDFYWADEVDGNVLFSTVDCTGHGVPGAFVSIVANNGLRRATNEFKLSQPNEVLDKLQSIVVESFKNQEQSDVKDGMDLAICTINQEKTKLTYSGANNPCYIIRNDEIFELKADKQPIGQYVDTKPFSLQSFDLKKEDCIYLTSDGYVDQFGGPKGKKFKSKAFKELLLQIYQLPMQEQLTIIQKTFDDWKAGFEQIDDVCVFGVKI